MHLVEELSQLSPERLDSVIEAVGDLEAPEGEKLLSLDGAVRPVVTPSAPGA